MMPFDVSPALFTTALVSIFLGAAFSYLITRLTLVRKMQSSFEEGAHSRDEEVRVLQSVANQSAVAIESSRLVDEVMKAREELQSRKIIEKAKGILMKERSMAEDEAFRTMRKKSMDTCRSMKEIAQAIILASEI